MTERDERRARLRAVTEALDTPVVFNAHILMDIRAELEASERDREALAEARESAKHARQFLHNKQPGAALSVLVTISMPEPTGD